MMMNGGGDDSDGEEERQPAPAINVTGPDGHPPLPNDNVAAPHFEDADFKPISPRRGVVALPDPYQNPEDQSSTDEDIAPPPPSRRKLIAPPDPSPEKPIQARGTPERDQPCSSRNMYRAGGGQEAGANQANFRSLTNNLFHKGRQRPGREASPAAAAPAEDPESPDEGIHEEHDHVNGMEAAESAAVAALVAGPTRDLALSQRAIHEREVRRMKALENGHVRWKKSSEVIQPPKLTKKEWAAEYFAINRRSGPPVQQKEPSPAPSLSPPPAPEDPQALVTGNFDEEGRIIEDEAAAVPEERLSSEEVEEQREEEPEEADEVVPRGQEEEEAAADQGQEEGDREEEEDEDVQEEIESISDDDEVPDVQGSDNSRSSRSSSPSSGGHSEQEEEEEAHNQIIEEEVEEIEEIEQIVEEEVEEIEEVEEVEEVEENVEEEVEEIIEEDLEEVDEVEEVDEAQEVQVIQEVIHLSDQDEPEQLQLPGSDNESSDDNQYEDMNGFAYHPNYMPLDGEDEEEDNQVEENHQPEETEQVQAPVPEAEAQPEVQEVHSDSSSNHEVAAAPPARRGRPRKSTPVRVAPAPAVPRGRVPRRRAPAHPPTRSPSSPGSASPGPSAPRRVPRRPPNVAAKRPRHSQEASVPLTSPSASPVARKRRGRPPRAAPPAPAAPSPPPAAAPTAPKKRRLNLVSGLGGKYWEQGTSAADDGETGRALRNREKSAGPQTPAAKPAKKEKKTGNNPAVAPDAPAPEAVHNPPPVQLSRLCIGCRKKSAKTSAAAAGSSGQEEKKEFWIVEKILNHKRTEEGHFYLIKWKNWSAEHNSWEPTSSIIEAASDSGLLFLQEAYDKLAKVATKPAEWTVAPAALRARTSQPGPSGVNAAADQPGPSRRNTVASRATSAPSAPKPSKKYPLRTKTGQ